MNILPALSITFHGYWHIGSGYGGGARCDRLMRKDPDGLPLLPGRTLHGHLRESTQTLEDMKWVATGTTDRLFGEMSPGGARVVAKICAPGRLVVDNGVLPEPEGAWLQSRDDERKRLYRVLRSTAIDDDGLAAENTLRAIEICVPLTLHAPVQLLDAGNDCGAADIETLRTACRLISRIGMGRHRGLGRCSVMLPRVDACVSAAAASGVAAASTAGTEES